MKHKKTKKPGRFIFMKDQGQVSLARFSFHASRLLVFVLVFGSLGGYLIYKSSAASTANVTVTNTSAGSIQTQLSTNLVTWAPLNGTTGAQAKFNSLHAPLVRIHLGDDGIPTMPEIKQNTWANNINGYTETRPFEFLDELVSEVYASGQQPMMNVKFAPDWMWSCYPNSIGVSGTQGTGSVTDATFNTFAQYMARLVDYYNNGSMVTEQGTTVTNPSGTSHKITYWELWNEPDLNNETPCAPSNGFGLTYQQYTTMWNAVTAAMLAKDPSLKFVGPATAGAQFGSSQTTGNQYVDYLMANSVTKPTALSFHGYGYWDNTVSDHWIFDGDNSDPANHCCGGITDFVNGVNAIHSSYPSLPIWLTEVNVNADWGNDTHKRPWSEFAAAWWGSMFAQGAPINVGIIHQYDALDDVQFGLININNGNTFIGYQVFSLLNQYFPQGSTILSASSDTTNVLTLAVRTPSGHTSVLVVNRQLASNTVLSSCGTGGVPVTVTVNLPAAPSAVTLRQIDKNNVNCTSNTGTAATSTAEPASATQTITFPGYGLAVLDVTPASADTTPPVISAVSSSGISGSAATISWTTDEAADSQVEYGTTTGYGSTSTLDTNLVSSHSESLSGLLPNTTYHYRVKSKDASGNLATGSDNTFTTTNTADTTPPAVSITLPAAGATLSGSSVTLTANASDNVGIASVDFFVTQGAKGGLAAHITSAPYSAVWDSHSVPDGTGYTLTATATDAAGNTTSASITVNVANGASVQGDLNSDSHVNITDLSILLSHYGQAVSAALGDINNDGTCNITDLSILLSHYGT